jgi:hypothetical protein
MRKDKSLEERRREAQQKKLGPHGIEPGESWGEGKNNETGQDVRDDAAPAVSPKRTPKVSNDQDDTSA